KLHEILGETEIRTNSFHHQANKYPAEGLQVSAMTDDRIVEAVESAQHDFVIGIQWHPEGTYLVDEASKKIFRAFIKAAAQLQR
ncbi:MAG: gamma-glutamyl-gamma-aminobutyrate hydrolase family protein, partial [Jeotgalicoccus sp.]|nr:gamma-glutamyl-gamma-aminobutyrate hydrolase family protein [Jeotgalicoccus sp.]